MKENLNLRTNISLWLIFVFLANTIGPIPSAQAQDFRLPAPGVMVYLSPEFDPPMLKGIKVHPDNPFRFDFILDRGDSPLSNEALKVESGKLIKYFLASITIPEKDLWVNLSPYEKDRIIPHGFGLTEMGRDLLAEDYMLKQITASLIYPEDKIGKKFWKRVYEEAAKRYGTTDIPVNTFNKVWIVPEKAVVYENANAGTAYVVESKLKVMLEQDYLALAKNTVILSAAKDLKTPLDSSATPQNDVNALGSQIIREIVIPELTREVNEDKNFSQLRQVYNSLILATWYKKKIKDSIFSKVYSDKNKVSGVNINDPQEKGRIYQRYLQAFKKGVYNYIKEEEISVSGMPDKEQGILPRKYFSGGLALTWEDWAMSIVDKLPDSAISDNDRSMIIESSFTPFDAAMSADGSKARLPLSDIPVVKSFLSPQELLLLEDLKVNIPEEKKAAFRALILERLKGQGILNNNDQISGIKELIRIDRQFMETNRLGSIENAYRAQYAVKGIKVPAKIEIKRTIFWDLGFVSPELWQEYLQDQSKAYYLRQDQYGFIRKELIAALRSEGWLDDDNKVKNADRLNSITGQFYKSRVNLFKLYNSLQSYVILPKGATLIASILYVFGLVSPSVWSEYLKSRRGLQFSRDENLEIADLWDKFGRRESLFYDSRRLVENMLSGNRSAYDLLVAYWTGIALKFYNFKMDPSVFQIAMEKDLDRFFRYQILSKEIGPAIGGLIMKHINLASYDVYRTYYGTRLKVPVKFIEFNDSRQWGEISGKNPESPIPVEVSINQFDRLVDDFLRSRNFENPDQLRNILNGSFLDEKKNILLAGEFGLSKERISAIVVEFRNWVKKNYSREGLLLKTGNNAQLTGDRAMNAKKTAKYGSIVLAASLVGALAAFISAIGIDRINQGFENHLFFNRRKLIESFKDRDIGSGLVLNRIKIVSGIKYYKERSDIFYDVRMIIKPMIESLMSNIESKQWYTKEEKDLCRLILIKRELDNSDSDIGQMRILADSLQNDFNGEKKRLIQAIDHLSGVYMHGNYDPQKPNILVIDGMAGGAIGAHQAYIEHIKDSYNVFFLYYDSWGNIDPPVAMLAKALQRGPLVGKKLVLAGHSTGDNVIRLMILRNPKVDLSRDLFIEIAAPFGGAAVAELGGWFPKITRFFKMVDITATHDPNGKIAPVIFSEENLRRVSQRVNVVSITADDDEFSPRFYNSGNFRRSWERAFTYGKHIVVPKTGGVDHHNLPSDPHVVSIILSLISGFEEGKIDHAMRSSSKTGGIDLTSDNMNLQVQNAGEGIKFHLDPVKLRQLQNSTGFVPVIINIRPLKSLQDFLGIAVVKPRLGGVGVAAHFPKTRLVAV
jgi:hypothetical protein